MLSMKKLRINKILTIIVVLTFFSYLFRRDSTTSSSSSIKAKPDISNIANTRANSIQTIELISNQLHTDLKILLNQKLANDKPLVNNDPSIKHIEKNSRLISDTDKRFLIVEYTNVNLLIYFSNTITPIPMNIG